MENKFAHTFGSTGLAAAEPMGDNGTSLGAKVGATATLPSSVGETATLPLSVGETATLPSSVGEAAMAIERARAKDLFDQYIALVAAKASQAERDAILSQYVNALTANDDPGGGSMDQIGGNQRQRRIASSEFDDHDSDGESDVDLESGEHATLEESESHVKAQERRYSDTMKTNPSESEARILRAELMESYRNNHYHLKFGCSHQELRRRAIAKVMEQKRAATSARGAKQAAVQTSPGVDSEVDGGRDTSSEPMTVDQHLARKSKKKSKVEKECSH
jgi:hypothetical protein